MQETHSLIAAPFSMGNRQYGQLRPARSTVDGIDCAASVWVWTLSRLPQSVQNRWSGAACSPQLLQKLLILIKVAAFLAIGGQHLGQAVGRRNWHKATMEVLSALSRGVAWRR